MAVALQVVRSLEHMTNKWRFREVDYLVSERES